MPELSGRKSCTAITENAQLLDLTQLSLPEAETGWFSFIDGNAEMAELIELEVGFWLRSACREYRRDWLAENIEHFIFISQLIEYRAVSDIFVISMTFSVVALIQSTLNRPVDGFSFPIKATEEKDSLKHDVMNKCLRVLATYQRWRQVKVIQRICGERPTTHVHEYLTEVIESLSPKRIFETFCQNCNLSEEATLMLSNLRRLVYNPELDIGTFLMSISTIMPPVGRGDPSILLEMIDREINFAYFMEKFLFTVSDEKVSSDYLSAIRELQTCSLRLTKLEELSSDQVPLLVEYLDHVETLCSFMSQLKADRDRFTRFQSFLTKAHFSTTLEWMWTYCTVISPDHSEDPLSVRLRTLTIDLSRLYIDGSEEHRLHLLKVMTQDAFYLDYPQYISLLIELRLMKSGGEVVGNIVKFLCQQVKTLNIQRPLLALGVLLKDRSKQARVLFTVRKMYSELGPDALTNSDWEVLTAVAREIPPEQRYVWLDKLFRTLYRSDSENVRIEGTALTIYAHESQGRFKLSLSYLTTFLDQVISVSTDQLLPSILQLREDIDVQRSRNSEHIQTDFGYVLELLWQKGILTCLTDNEQYPEKSGFVQKLASLYMKLSSEPDATHYCANLYLSMQQYASVHPEDEDYLAVFSQIPEKAAMSIRSLGREKRIDLLEMIPLLKIEFMQKPVRPVITKWIEDNQFSLEKVSELKALFWAKKRDLDYMEVLNLAVKELQEPFKGNEEKYIHLIQELAELMIEHKNRKVVNMSLQILCNLVLKERDIRPHLLTLLQNYRLYIRFFHTFRLHLGYLSSLKAQIKTVSAITESHISKLQDAQEFIIHFLHLIEICCDGCYRPFQDFFRDQNQGPQNESNLILIVTELAEELLMEEGNADLRNQCIDTLLEATTGPCVENQKVICANKDFLTTVMLYVKQMNDSETQECAWLEQHRFLLKLVHLMRTLVEGHERDYATIQNLMGEHIDFEAFFTMSVHYAKRIADSDLKKLELLPPILPDEHRQQKQRDLITSTGLDQAYTAFELSVSCMLLCYSAWAQEEEKLISLFQKHRLIHYVATVEIQVEDGEVKTLDENKKSIRTLAFKVPFQCHFLTKFSAQRLLFELDRDSRQQKLDDFTYKVKICCSEMEIQQRLSRAAAYKAFTRLWQVYWLASFVLVVLINVMLLFSVEISAESRFHIDHEVLTSVLRPLSLMQAVLMTAGGFAFYSEYWKTLMTPLKSRNASNELEELPDLDDPGSLKVYFSDKRHEAHTNDSEEWLKFFTQLCFLLLAWIAVSHPVLYPILLLQIVNLNEAVVNILKSVTSHWSQLVLTLIFCLISLYLFTFVAYFEYSRYYVSDSGLVCDTLFECFISTMNLGMRSGGGIGDVYGPPEPQDFVGRVVFDLLFYLSITVVLMAIVFGIIVDTFSELRSDRNLQEFDMNNVCMICGKTRSMIEVKGEGWQKHTQLVHNPFSYLYFLIHLKYSHPDDCTGLEKEIKDKLEQNHFDFYPTTSTVIGFEAGSEE